MKRQQGPIEIREHIQRHFYFDEMKGDERKVNLFAAGPFLQNALW